MATLNGCIVPDKLECELCGQKNPQHEVLWHQVHDHPAWLVCTECREKMDSWEPLDIWLTDEETVALKPKPKVKPKPKLQRVIAIGVPMGTDPTAGPPPEKETFKLDIDTSITLDDL